MTDKESLSKLLKNSDFSETFNKGDFKVNAHQLHNFLKFNALESMDSELVQHDDGKATPEVLGPRLRHQWI